MNTKTKHLVNVSFITIIYLRFHKSPSTVYRKRVRRNGVAPCQHARTATFTAHRKNHCNNGVHPPYNGAATRQVPELDEHRTMALAVYNLRAQTGMDTGKRGHATWVLAACTLCTRILKNRPTAGEAVACLCRASSPHQSHQCNGVFQYGLPAGYLSYPSF